MKGYKQKFGIDYFEVFTPVIIIDIIQMIVVLIAQNQWKIHQMDVKLAFLNSFLDKKMYVE